VTDPETSRPDPAADPASGPVRPQVLDVRGLTVRFGGVTALDKVSLTVRPGEIVGLIGPNGAGKSTLIDALSGFARPAEGQILLGDVDVTDLPAHWRVRHGLVRSWQSLELFEDINVKENLELGAARPGWGERLRSLMFSSADKVLGAKAATAADRFQLAPDLRRSPRELSFSQRRMITTARAVALDPSILLLDEPAAGMSDVRREALAEPIRALARERGMGLLVVEHDMPFVMGLCDRIVVLNFGRKIAEGTPAEVRANPDVIKAYLRGETEAGGDDGAPSQPAAVRRSDRAGADGRGECLLAARDLAVGYYGRPVVRGVNLELRPGEVIALLGANRAGKTTTMLGLAGAIAPLEGEVEWQGTVVAKRATPQRLASQGLGFLTDDRAVFRQLTVAENLRVGRCEVSRAIGLFPELQPILKRKVGLLSGGEQQMVGLARALARDPKVILVDEMSLGLAPRIVTRLMDALRQAADEHGVGVIVVEQHVPQALRIADRVCVVAGGRMTLNGLVDDVRDRVDEAFLADVLGTSAPTTPNREEDMVDNGTSSGVTR
jgi:ABC-type branched-subunit amino acid transport system ATPase component